MTASYFLVVIGLCLSAEKISANGTGGCSSNGSRPGMPGAFVPQCDSQGNWLPEQCHGSTGYCWCVTTSGTEIPNTRTLPSQSSQRKNCAELRRTSEGAFKSDSGMADNGMAGSGTYSNSGMVGSGSYVNPGGSGSYVSPGGTGSYVRPGCTGTNCGSGNYVNPSGGNYVMPGGGNYVRPGGTGCTGNNCNPGSGNFVVPGGGNYVTSGGCTGTGCNPGSGNFVVPGGGNYVTPGGCTGTGCNPGGGNFIVPGGGNYITPGGCTGTGCNPGGGNYVVPGGNNQNCPDPNAQYAQCAPPCEDTCYGKPADCGMSASCTPGCTCRSGYVREAASLTSRCIPRSQCTGTGTGIGTGNIETGNNQCNEANTQFMQCMPPCEESCYGKPADCGMGPTSCVSGCSCRPGYVRQGASALTPCVPRSQCPANPNPNPNPNPYPNPNPNPNPNPSGQCSDPNSMFTQCGSACPESCQGKATMCSMQCVQGCFCKPGYVKQTSSPSSQCVMPSQCQGNNCQGGNCNNNNNNNNNCNTGNCNNNNNNNQCTDPNSEFTQCGSACPTSCQQSNAVCSFQCVQGCFCKQGYVRLTSARNAPCVRQNQCNTYGGFRFIRLF